MQKTNGTFNMLKRQRNFKRPSRSHIICICHELVIVAVWNQDVEDQLITTIQKIPTGATSQRHTASAEESVSCLVLPLQKLEFSIRPCRLPSMWSSPQGSLI